MWPFKASTRLYLWNFFGGQDKELLARSQVIKQILDQLGKKAGLMDDVVDACATTASIHF
jgi:hypothetical protein